MIVAVAPCFGCGFLVTVIAESQSGNALSFELYADLACFTDWRRCTVGEEHLNIVLGIGLTHAARLRLHTDNICDRERCFGLAEALHELETCCTIELVEYLGVQCLTCDAGIF